MKSLLKMGWSRLLTVVLAVVFGLSMTLGYGAPVSAQEGGADISDVNGIPVVELETKIDVNYAILRRYRELPGFYPTLAKKLVMEAPFDDVEEVLDIDGLSDIQVQLLQANMKNLVAGPYDEGANYLENRINKGYYD